MNALFDTSVLIDHLLGVPAAGDELDRYNVVMISRVVWIEFRVGKEMPVERIELLKAFAILELDESIAAETVRIRQSTKLRLPDAIILATARVHDLLLVTCNHRDFSRRDPHVRIPY